MDVSWYDAYAAAFKALGESKVRFVMIGVAAINFYAEEPGSMYATQDVDILIAATKKNLVAALRALRGAGFSLECNGEPVVSVDEWLAERMLERRAVVTARKSEGARLDVVLESGGASFSQWNKAARRFRVAGSSVRVGSLPDLLRAKQLANREKDRKFLSLYETQAKEMLARSRRKRKS